MNIKLLNYQRPHRNSRSSKGVSIGQVYSLTFVCTYYVALMALTLSYLFDSFSSPLPWAECRSDWNESVICIPSGDSATAKILQASKDKALMMSSAELYYL